jgi:5-methyltetrahydropteroyltriglutamate--homocysteine methyltransferase
MRRSDTRLLVSHAGTLPRPANVTAEAPAGELDAAVTDVVHRQAETGLDIVNDGEFPKRGTFTSYIRDRMTGFEHRPGAPPRRDDGISGRDRSDFPGFYAAGLGGFSGRARSTSTGGGHYVVTSPLSYTGRDRAMADAARLTGACAAAGRDVTPYLPAVAPGTIEHWLYPGDQYASEEELLFAIADVMHEEYKTIADAGILLQIDDPDLADAWQMYPSMSVADYRRYAQVRVEALNHALRGIPEESVRLHVCWGSFHGPHVNDIALRDIADLILTVRAGCYSVEAANPRHEHEWEVWGDVKLPDGKALMPGVVGHASDLVEHPRLVAQRLIRYAEAVGRENVIAGTDCGLGTRTGHPEITWAKLAALAEGAGLATRELWNA